MTSSEVKRVTDIEWRTKTVPEAFKTAKKSKEFIRLLTKIGISHICYVRNAFPPLYFHKIKVEGASVMMLKEYYGDERMACLLKWLVGASHALKQGFLKELILHIRHPIGDQTISEKYKFIYQYHEDKMILSEDSAASISNNVSMFFTKSFDGLKNPLPPINGRAQIDLDIIYQENTPPVYEAPYFGPKLITEANGPDMETEDLLVVKTPFHKLQVKVSHNYKDIAVQEPVQEILDDEEMNRDVPSPWVVDDNESAGPSLKSSPEIKAKKRRKSLSLETPIQATASYDCPEMKESTSENAPDERPSLRSSPEIKAKKKRKSLSLKTSLQATASYDCTLTKESTSEKAPDEGPSLRSSPETKAKKKRKSLSLKTPLQATMSTGMKESTSESVPEEIKRDVPSPWTINDDNESCATTAVGTACIQKINCTCGSKINSVYPKMKCRECGTYQHAACYRILKEESIPQDHICFDCASNNTALKCTCTSLLNIKKDRLTKFCVLHLLVAYCYITRNTPDMILAELSLTNDDYESQMNFLTRLEIIRQKNGRRYLHEDTLEEKAHTFFMDLRYNKNQIEHN